MDFWNFTLNVKRWQDSNVITWKVDWTKLAPTLVDAAVARINPKAEGEYQGLNVYGSYGSSQKGLNLKNWTKNFLEFIPGIKVSMVERTRKLNPPKCPTCYTEVYECPECSADMRGTKEKGVDVRIATDMISLAWEGNYDVAVLISSDRDFAPLAEFLGSKGIKVIHGTFNKKGSSLSAKCWSKINLADIRENFRLHEN